MIARVLYKLGISVAVQHYMLLIAPPHVKEITVTGIFITINCWLWQYGTHTGMVWYSRV